MSAKPDRKERAALLKRVRAARGEMVKAAQEERKAVRALRRKIEQALAGGPKTVPDLAEAVGAVTDTVLWHVTAMKKYGRVVEDEQDGDWFRYRLVEKEAKEEE